MCLDKEKNRPIFAPATERNGILKKRFQNKVQKNSQKVCRIKKRVLPLRPL